MPDILGLHDAVRQDTSFRQAKSVPHTRASDEILTAGQVRERGRERERARRQRSLRHLTPLEQQRDAHNPLSSIREVYNHTDTSKAMRRGQRAVTHAIQVRYSNSSFINNADYKLLRENTACHAYNIWV